MSDLILYTTDDGKSQIQLRADLGTVWLTQLEMAELFDATKQNISLHLKNIFEDGELAVNSVVKESLTTASDAKKYRTQLYNLDAILAVGYRVRSPRGVQFRRWASTVLKEYLVKGFVMDDERLKNPDGRPDYFDEMLARIRDIRASGENVGQIVVSNGFALLSGAGTISHAHMEQKLEPLYLDFDQRRKAEEARTADAQDEADLQALENTVKNRPKP
jgi:hypothetical protein